MKKIRGFTLIELMIVVGIIGILSMLAFPAYQNYMLKVRIANFMNDAVMPYKSIAQEKITEGYSPSSEGNVIQATTSKTAGMFKSATVRFVMSSAVGKDKKGRADTYMVEAVLAPAHFLKNGSDTSIGFRMYAISNENQIKSISDWDGRTDIKLIELYHQFGVGSLGRTGSIIRWVCGISSQEMLSVTANPELYQLFMALPKECKNVLVTA